VPVLAVAAEVELLGLPLLALPEQVQLLVGEQLDVGGAIGRLVQGRVGVQRNGRALGYLDSGDCFGETSYVRGAKRTATINASGAVTVMKVSSTLLEQVSAECQLRFNQVFLRSMIGRLQSAERGIS